VARLGASPAGYADSLNRSDHCDPATSGPAGPPEAFHNKPEKGVEGIAGWLFRAARDRHYYAPQLIRLNARAHSDTSVRSASLTPHRRCVKKHGIEGSALRTPRMSRLEHTPEERGNLSFGHVSMELKVEARGVVAVVVLVAPRHPPHLVRSATPSWPASGRTKNPMLACRAWPGSAGL
jgi:hypothetical protein